MMELSFIQSLILGIIQGIAEWLPVSSSGITAFIMSNFFDMTNVESILSEALWLHLGTFFAGLIYFWKDVFKIVKAPIKPTKENYKERKTFTFVLIATIISGAIGVIIFELISSSEGTLELTGKAITGVVGGLLLLTACIQLWARSKNISMGKEIKYKDGVISGLAQGAAALPGVSRSGITVSALLLRKFDDTAALRLSFLMSLPIVLAGNIFLNINNFAIGGAAIYGLLASFVFGIATIHGLMKLSRKINFGWFALVFALLMLASLFI